jgi:hypothetical protein
MEVEEILGLNDYFNDRRFQSKKPNLRGDWKDRCGDNFYSRAHDGSWVQHRNRYHLDERAKQQDTRFARVFVARRFWYRGKLAECTRIEFAPLFGGRNARVNHDPALSRTFIEWVTQSFEPGVAGAPNDNPDIQKS